MDLFRQALIIMCLGMGLTFVFLYMVILAVQFTGWLVRRCEAGLETEEAGTELRSGAVVAAIAAAVNEHESGGHGRG